MFNFHLLTKIIQQKRRVFLTVSYLLTDNKTLISGCHEVKGNSSISFFSFWSNIMINLRISLYNTF